MSTFVLRSKANILDSVQRKCFLSLSPLINSSSSYCAKSEIDDNRSKMLFVESQSSFPPARYAYNSLVISSKISALSVSTPTCDSLKSKRFSVDPLELLNEILKYFFSQLFHIVFCSQNFFFWYIFFLKKASYFLFEALFLYLITLKKLPKVRNLTILLFWSICQMLDVFVQ